MKNKMKYGYGFFLLIFCFVSCKPNENSFFSESLASIPEIKSLQIKESEAIHIVGSYFDAEIELLNGDSFVIGEIKSDLSFDRNTKLYSVNNTELFCEDWRTSSMFVPMIYLSAIYEKKIDNIDSFLKNYSSICDLLNIENISEKRFQYKDNKSFRLMRHNDKKIQLHR